jgi:hypothetical protein
MASDQARGLACGEGDARAQRGSVKDWSKGRSLCAPGAVISCCDLTMEEANGFNPTLDGGFRLGFPTRPRVRARIRDCLYFKKERSGREVRDRWRGAGEAGGVTRRLGFLSIFLYNLISAIADH